MEEDKKAVLVAGPSRHVLLVELAYNKGLLGIEGAVQRRAELVELCGNHS